MSQIIATETELLHWVNANLNQASRHGIWGCMDKISYLAAAPIAGDPAITQVHFSELKPIWNEQLKTWQSPEDPTSFEIFTKEIRCHSFIGVHLLLPIHINQKQEAS